MSNNPQPVRLSRLHHLRRGRQTSSWHRHNCKHHAVPGPLCVSISKVHTNEILCSLSTDFFIVIAKPFLQPAQVQPIKLVLISSAKAYFKCANVVSTLHTAPWVSGPFYSKTDIVDYPHQTWNYGVRFLPPPSFFTDSPPIFLPILASLATVTYLFTKSHARWLCGPFSAKLWNTH